MSERRPVLIADWHPVARTLLAIVSAGLALYFWLKGDPSDTVGALIVLALCI